MDLTPSNRRQARPLSARNLLSLVNVSFLSSTQKGIDRNRNLMAMMHSNRVTEGVEVFGKVDNLDHASVSPRRAEIQSGGDHTPVVCSRPSSSPPNGPASPISSLLEEILIMIFEDVITSESLLWISPRKHVAWQSQSPPRNLASVSRTWRSVVFSCPMLWRYAFLTPGQPIHALKEHLRNSSPLTIHLMVHQWPFRNPIPTSGPYSTIALTAQLQSILSPMEKEDGTLVPACHRIESISINATESSTFINFVLQTWTGRGSRFPALRQVATNGNVCATWSRACFFDGTSAPELVQLSLSNVVIAYDMYRLPWGAGLNLTTLVWAAPVQKRGSIIVSVACFHHIVSSFPNLVKLELQGHVVGFEFATLESLEGSGVTPLTHIRELRLNGRVFPNASSAVMLFCLLPMLRRVAVRGRASSGPFGLRTVALALQALICLPRMHDWPLMLSDLEDLELECVDGSACAAWKTWCMDEIELWKEWRETMANSRKERNAAKVRVHLVMGEMQTETDEGELDDD